MQIIHFYSETTLVRSCLCIFWQISKLHIKLVKAPFTTKNWHTTKTSFSFSWRSTMYDAIHGTLQVDGDLKCSTSFSSHFHLNIQFMFVAQKSSVYLFSHYLLIYFVFIWAKSVAICSKI